MRDEASAFGALADHTRRAVLSMLSEHGELTVTQIAEKFDHIGRTAVSMQLRVLRDAGLVSERPAGRFRYYSLRVEPMNQVVEFLSTLYGASLDGLAAAADQPDESEPERPRWGTSY